MMEMLVSYLLIFMMGMIIGLIIGRATPYKKIASKDLIEKVERDLKKLQTLVEAGE